MKPKLSFVNSEIEQIKKSNLYRILKKGSVNGAYITINKKKLLNLSSNDYLGIPTTKINIKQSASSSRLVSGNDLSYDILEKKLSKHKSQEESLIYPTGYMANLGSIVSLAKKGDLILSDELNHASIIEACKLSNAKISVYKHNDVKNLELKLKEKTKRKFIVTEGIFSMDGDFAKLKDITKLAEQKNAIVILDDAHGDFTIGRDGKGTANHLGVSKKIDLYISSLSKGLGSFGGYIASQKNVVDLCINKSKSFIYTSAITSFLIEYSIKRFDSNREKQRKILEKNVKHFVTGLKKLGYQINSQTHIIPIVIGDEKTTLDFGKFLYGRGLYAQPIRYPTVPHKKARIRLSVTAWLTRKQIEDSLRIFDLAGKRFGII